MIVVQSYRANLDTATPGSNLDVYVTLYNAGQRPARNILISFAPGSLLPLATGGIRAVSEIAPGDRVEIKQPFNATWELWGLPVATLKMTASYLNPSGDSFTEKYSLTLPVAQPTWRWGGGKKRPDWRLRRSGRCSPTWPEPSR